jgi:hypothetical protein
MPASQPEDGDISGIQPQLSCQSYRHDDERNFAALHLEAVSYAPWNLAGFAKVVRRVRKGTVSDCFALIAGRFRGIHDHVGKHPPWEA